MTASPPAGETRSTDGANVTIDGSSSSSSTAGECLSFQYMRGFFAALSGRMGTEVGLGGFRRCLPESLVWREDAGGPEARLERVSRTSSTRHPRNCQGFRWADACWVGRSAPAPAPGPPGPRAVHERSMSVIDAEPKETIRLPHHHSPARSSSRCRLSRNQDQISSALGESPLGHQALQVVDEGL